jgi:dihydropteroate synthase
MPFLWIRGQTLSAISKKVVIFAAMIHVMGIINLTPDSFYAGSRTAACDFMSKVRQMLSDGADVIDIGACSTRPGAPQPSIEEEWARLEPVLRQLSAETAVSIDTYRSEIVRRAYDLIGPFMVNDISAGALDPSMLETVGELGLPYVAMHMRGTPENMQQQTAYQDIVADVKTYFEDFAARAEAAGIREWLLDPGFGFAKTLEQNYKLLNRLDALTVFGRPILVGVSRKSMVYKPLGITPEEALPATQVVQFAALEKGASWLRVHDVAEAVRTARLYSTIYTSSPGAAK